MNFSQRSINWLTGICIAISGSLFILASYALWKTDNSGGNHSFLFGTACERILLKYELWFLILGSFPLALPLLFKRNVLNVVLAVIAVLLFFFLKWVLFVISD